MKSSLEYYDNQVNPNVKSFWIDIRNSRSKHIFSKHPIMSVYGDDLSKKAYANCGIEPLSPEIMENIILSLQHVMNIEEPHKKELEELAKDVIVEIWGVPRDILDAEITSNTQGDYDESSPDEDTEISEELRKHINKRISLNTLTQGAAVHQMRTMHHIVNRRLDEINTEILNKYNELTRLMHRYYWWLDPSSLIGNLGKASIGKEELKWSENKPTIKAKALIFPILAQELSKGVMELITTHGYSNLDSETQYEVIKYGDKIAYEPWQIQIGPELWKHFLSVIPSNIKISNIVTQLSLLEPDEVHTILSNVIDNPKDAKESLRRFEND